MDLEPKNKDVKEKPGLEPDWQKWLASFETLSEVVREMGIRQVLKILQDVEDTRAAALAAALAPRVDVLETAPSQLAPQLLARIRPDQSEGLEKLLDGARSWRNDAWLMPVGASLSDSGEPLAGSFQAHLKFIGALRILPDGKRYASSSEDGTIRIWALSPEGNLPLATLDEHLGPVNDIIPSWDGQFLISASDDRTVKVWDLESLEPLLTLKGHMDYVSTLAALPEHRVASGSKDGTIRIWDINSGECLATFDSHGAWVNALTVTPDGSLLISASINNMLKTWDMQTLTEAAPFFEFEGADYSKVLMGSVFFTPSNKGEVGHKSHPGYLLVSPDGKTLVSGEEELILWNIVKREQIVRFPAHTPGLLDMVWLDEGQTLATAGREIKIWELKERKVLQTFTLHEGEVNSLAASPDGVWLISGGKDNTIKFWDLSGQTSTNPWQGHSQSIHEVAFSPDEGLAVSVGTDSKVRIWDIQTGCCRHVGDGNSYPSGHIGGFLEAQKAVITTNWDGEVFLWDLVSGQLRLKLIHPEKYFSSSYFTVLPGKTQAIFSGFSQPMSVWELAKGAAPQVLAGSFSGLVDVSVTRDEKYFAAVYFSRVKGDKFAEKIGREPSPRKLPLQWWHLPDRKMIWEFLPEGDPVDLGYFCHVLLTEDETRLVTATSTGWLGIFEAASGKRLAWWRGDSGGYVTSMQLLPDGRLLICSDEVVGLDEEEEKITNYILRWWDLATQTCQRELVLDDVDARTPQITPDGCWAAFPSGQKECLWDLVNDRIVACFYGKTKLLFDAISRDGKTIIVGEDGGAFHVLRLNTP